MEGVIHKILLKLHNNTFRPKLIFLVIPFVALHAMREAIAQKQYFACFEWLKRTTHEAGARAVFEIDDFEFGMKMPGVCKVFVVVKSGF